MTGRPSVREFVFQSLPGTRKEIELRSGVSSSSVGYWLGKFKAANEIHIGAWRRSDGQGAIQPIFVEGEGKDAPKPKAYTTKQNDKRRRNKERREGISDVKNAKRRAHYHADKLSKIQNDWLGALR